MRIVGISEQDFHELFLVAADLPQGMRQIQDSSTQGPDVNDVYFPRHRGVFGGFNVWEGQPEARLWRIVDIRWSFPRVSDAIAYQDEALNLNSEGVPAVHTAELVGDQCHVFGYREGATARDESSSVPELDTAKGAHLGAEAKTELNITAFHYVFRVANVVLKVFVACGPRCPARSRLTPGDVRDVAMRAAERVLTVAQ